MIKVNGKLLTATDRLTKIAELTGNLQDIATVHQKEYYSVGLIYTVSLSPFC